MKSNSPVSSKRRPKRKSSKKKKAQQQTAQYQPPIPPPSFLRTGIGNGVSATGAATIAPGFGIGLSSSLMNSATSREDTTSKSTESSELIRVPLVFGNVSVASELRDDTQWYEWTVYVRGLRNEDLSYCIDRVVFVLHPDFVNPIRVVDEPPFEVTEQGWGDFPVDICIFAKSGASIELWDRLKSAHPDWKGQCSGSSGCHRGRIDGLPNSKERSVTIAELTALPSAESLQRHHRSRQGRLFGGESFDMEDDSALMMAADEGAAASSSSSLSTRGGGLSHRRRKSRRTMSSRKGGKLATGDISEGEEESCFGQEFAFGVDLSGMAPDSLLARDVAALKESANQAAQRAVSDDSGRIPGMVRLNHHLTLTKDGSKTLVHESLCELMFHCAGIERGSKKLRKALLMGPNRCLNRHRYHDLWLRSTMDLCESEQSLIARILAVHEQVLTEMAPLIAEFNSRYPPKIAVPQSLSAVALTGVATSSSSSSSSNPMSAASLSSAASVVSGLPRTVSARGSTAALFATHSASATNPTASGIPTIPLIPPPTLIQQPPMKRHRKA